MNIAAYCRVSTDKADQLNSLEAQKEFFSEYTKRTGDTLVRLYADDRKIMHPFPNMQVPNMPKLHPTSLQSKYHSCLLCLPAAFDPLFISLSEYFCCPHTPPEFLL